MSVTIYGQHDGDAIFEDDINEGLQRVPVRLVHTLHQHACMSIADEIAWMGRTYARDDLGAIRKDIDANALMRLDTCAFTTPAGDCDQPALHGRYCPQHAKD